MKHRVMFVVFALLLALTWVHGADKKIPGGIIFQPGDVVRCYAAGTDKEVPCSGTGVRISPPACCNASELQSLKLQVAQRDAQLARVPVQAAFAEFQKAQQKLYDLAEQVKKDNGWPAGTSFDGEKLAFTAPAPPAEKEKPAASSQPPAASKPTEPQVPTPPQDAKPK